MLCSPRPYPCMSAFSTSRSTPPGRLVAAAIGMCAALPLLAAASVHHAVVPVHRAVPTARPAHVEPAAHALPQGHRSVPVSAHGSRTSASMRVASGTRMRSRQVTPLNAQAAQHMRSRGQGRSIAGNPGRPVQVDAQRTRQTVQRATAARHPVPAEDVAAVDNAASTGTIDRVHAWYGAHRATPQGTAARPAAPNAAPARVDRPGVDDSATRLGREPDLARSAPKATSADFDRAAAAQRQTIRSAAEQNRRQTTAADDAADAESQIPGTAPTEREPLPFIHGVGAPAQAAPVPGSNSSRRIPAPIVRQRPQGATAQTTSKTQPPANPGTDETFDLTPPVAAMAKPVPALSQPAEAYPDIRAMPPLPDSRAASAPANRVSEVRALQSATVAAATNSPVRTSPATAAETVASPTPTLQLPSPQPVSRKPAIAAIQQGSRHPMLDPAVTSGMAEQTFDAGDAPATAGTAVRLATLGAVTKAKSAVVEYGDADPAAALSAVRLFDGQGHLLMLPAMKGSHDILVHQNLMAVADGLERVQNDSQLADMRRLKLIVALPDDDSVYPNDALPLNRRFARPWTVRFVRDMARAHSARFGTPLIVTSAVRTVEFQRRLVRVNGNAAPPTGDIASPHLYGQAIDIAKGGMSLTEIMWMRAYLTPVQNDGKIDVEEEFQQACFHVSVYRRYLGEPPARQRPEPPLPALMRASAPPAPPVSAKHRRLSTALLAAHLP